MPVGAQPLPLVIDCAAPACGARLTVSNPHDIPFERFDDGETMKRFGVRCSSCGSMTILERRGNDTVIAFLGIPHLQH